MPAKGNSLPGSIRLRGAPMQVELASERLAPVPWASNSPTKNLYDFETYLPLIVPSPVSPVVQTFLMRSPQHHPQLLERSESRKIRN